MGNLSGIIKSIQNIMREDKGVDGDAQRLSQLAWMLFLKMFDEQEAEIELMNTKYKSPIPEELRWRNWASDTEGITGDDLSNLINNKLFPALKNMEVTAKEDPAGFIVHSVFEDSYNYMKSGTIIRRVINKMNDFSFNRKADRDQFGDIYETLLQSLQSAGNAGEFYTPRAVTQFIVDMVNPKLGEKIFDPSCGTGGFLTSAIEHIRQNDVHTAEDEALIKKTIMGVEYKQFPYTLCINNMMLHGLKAPTNIRHDDSLARPIKDIRPEEKVDVIITNPPFGGTVGDGILANFPSGFRTKETADLFLILFLKLLKPGGRAGIVLPDGSLIGDGIKVRIREKLLADTSLHTIIRLPKSVFAPYANISTNLLFFEKGKKTKDVWYYEFALPKGVKAYSKTKPIRIEEFNDLKKWWNNRKESAVCWKVSIKDLQKNDWNLDISNPNKKENVIDSPDNIIKQYNESEILSTDLFNKLLRYSSGIPKNKFNFLSKNPEIFLLRAENSNYLKEFFLESAIRGNLTIDWRKNNKNFISAKSLLEKVLIEKQNLIKNKLIKNYQLPVIKNTPFVLPDNWEWCYFSDIASFKLGKTPPSKDNSFWNNGEYHWVSISDMNEYGEVMETKKKITKKAVKETFGYDPIKKGTLLMSFKLTIGRTSLLGIDAFHNEAIISISPFSNISKKYLFYFLPIFSNWGNKRNAIKGDTLNSEKLATLLIPLPPPLEQEQIVLEVEKLISDLNNLKKIITNKNKSGQLLVQSLLNESLL